MLDIVDLIVNFVALFVRISSFVTLLSIELNQAVWLTTARQYNWKTVSFTLNHVDVSECYSSPFNAAYGS